MGTWAGFNRHRDLPMLGIDPDAWSDWEPVDSGLRPDNRDPMEFVEDATYYAAFGQGEPIMLSEGTRGKRPDIGPSEPSVPGDPLRGRELMAYHRALATAQTMSVESEELTLRTVGF